MLDNSTVLLVPTPLSRNVLVWYGWKGLDGARLPIPKRTYHHVEISYTVVQQELYMSHLPNPKVKQVLVCTIHVVPQCMIFLCDDMSIWEYSGSHLPNPEVHQELVDKK
jgi:hypothetical protein